MNPQIENMLSITQIDSFEYYMKKILLLFPFGLLSYLTPLVPLCFAMLFFVLVDTGFGMWAARKKGEKIISRKMKRIVVKLIVYLGAILVGFVFDKQILASNTLIVTRGTVFILATIEVKSIFESMTIISGIQIWDKLKHLFDEGKPKK